MLLPIFPYLKIWEFSASNFETNVKGKEIQPKQNTIKKQTQNTV